MDFLEMYNYPYMSDTNFLDLLHLQRQRTLMSKIIVLDWQERHVGEVQGLVVDGSLSADANSTVRRTCSLTMVVNEDTVDITGMTGLVGLNRKIKIFVGVRNDIQGYKEKYGDIIWFPMGIFVMTQSSIRHDVSSNTISLSVQDKMCLLNGEVSGVLQNPVDFAKYEQIGEDGERESHYNQLYDIIRTAVIQFGQEDPSKVIISDLPLEVRKSMTYTGTKDIFVDTVTGQHYNTDAPGRTRVKKGENFGFKMEPFTVPSKELMKQAGDTITSVLDDLVGILGNYEYFYDIEGNFVFQEIKNYLNTANKPYYELENGDYAANFSDNGLFYSFIDKENVASYANNPDWSNIKNDFVVWGTSEGDDNTSYPISYHVAIDDVPYNQEYYDNGTPVPWQQTILNYESNNGRYQSPYYQELIAKWPRTEYNKQTNQWVYDNDTKEWNENSAYYLDLISTNSEVGKYSVSNIGRRTKVVVDENVKLMYPPIVKDMRIVFQDDFVNQTVSIPTIVIDEQGNEQVKVMVVDAFEYEIENLKKQGIKFLKVMSEDSTLKSNITGAKILKDAFSKIRELLFLHSTMNEVVNINCIPLYFFDVNKKIEASDKSADINGFYMVRSFNLPLSVDGQMSITTIRATSRL